MDGQYSKPFFEDFVALCRKSYQVDKVKGDPLALLRLTLFDLAFARIVSVHLDHSLLLKRRACVCVSFYDQNAFSVRT